MRSQSQTVDGVASSRVATRVPSALKAMREMPSLREESEASEAVVGGEMGWGVSV